MQSPNDEGHSVRSAVSRCLHQMYHVYPVRALCSARRRASQMCYPLYYRAPLVKLYTYLGTIAEDVGSHTN